MGGRVRIIFISGLIPSFQASSGSWWWTGKPGVLQSMGSQGWTRPSDWTEPSFLLVSMHAHTHHLKYETVPSRVVSCWDWAGVCCALKYTWWKCLCLESPLRLVRLLMNLVVWPAFICITCIRNACLYFLMKRALNVVLFLLKFPVRIYGRFHGVLHITFYSR